MLTARLSRLNIGLMDKTELIFGGADRNALPCKKGDVADVLLLEKRFFKPLGGLRMYFLRQREFQ